MDEITQADVQNLLEQSGEYLSSVYMPTEKSGGIKAREKERTRFKNLIGALEEQLQASDANKQHKAQLERLKDLRSRDYFWQNLSHGLAVFASPDDIQTMKLPVTFNPLAFLGSDYYLKPLLTLPVAEKSFYLLAVSYNQVRLFEANAYRIWQIETEALPESIDDALGTSENEQSLQFRTQTPTAPGGQGQAVFHGHGGQKDLGDIEPPRYLQAIATSLNRVIGYQDKPLIFAGVEELFALYKQHNKYSNFIEQNLPGNHEHTQLEELHQRGLKAAESYLFAGRIQAEQKYLQLAGSNPDQVTTVPDDVLKLAGEGRLEAVFLPKDSERWVEIENGQINKTYEENNLQSVGLFDVILKQVLSQSGSAFVVEEDQLPDQPLAAMLRY